MANYHFAELIHRQAEKYGDRVALKYLDQASGKWQKISWKEFSRRVMLTAKAIAEFGIEPQENVGVYSQNMPQCLFTDFGAYANRVVTVPMYATNSPEQIEFIINDATIHTLFVGEQLQYNNAFKVQKRNDCLKRIVVFDPNVKLNPEDKTSIFFGDFLRLGDCANAEAIVNVRMKEASPEDLATIIYTSGTTGNSKGVMLHHSNYLEAMRIHDIRLTMVNDRDTALSFLPLTHIFEKAWVCYCLHKGVTVVLNQDPKQITEVLPAIRPTLMCNVPRFWEKVYTGVHDKIHTFPRPIQRMIMSAIETGRLYLLEYRNKGIEAPATLKAKFNLYDKTIFQMLKKVIGIDRGRLFPVAGAPLADHINEFLQSVNIPIAYGYGLSETTATVSFYVERGFVIGSIGTVMPGLEVKIDPANQEILVKGKTVTCGYYKRPDENERSFTPDGFFRTGDAGRLEGDTLYFTERIKDLYKTSNGKYIAPQAIEGVISSDRFVEQIAVIADQRKFVSALIVPNFQALEEYAERKGWPPFASHEEATRRPEVVRLFEVHIEKSQQNFAPFEKIKRFTLLSEPFTMEGRELTDTLKLRRRVIAEKYAERIEAMYRD